MLRGVITITRLATITVIELLSPSKFKIFSLQPHQFKENNPFATQAQKVAPTQSRHLARRITRDANNRNAKSKTLVEMSDDFFVLFSLWCFC